MKFLSFIPPYYLNIAYNLFKHSSYIIAEIYLSELTSKQYPSSLIISIVSLHFMKIYVINSYIPSSSKKKFDDISITLILSSLSKFLIAKAIYLLF